VSLNACALSRQVSVPDSLHPLGQSVHQEISQTILEVRTMNNDIFEGKWKQIRGEAKSWWGKLTDDDLERAAGKFDVFTGLLQEKYGYSRQAAADEIDKRVTEYEARLKSAEKP
jgi:uncharacterized protein YjbJ (UPF0337 family)